MKNIVVGIVLSLLLFVTLSGCGAVREAAGNITPSQKTLALSWFKDQLKDLIGDTNFEGFNSGNIADLIDELENQGQQLVDRIFGPTGSASLKAGKTLSFEVNRVGAPNQIVTCHYDTATAKYVYVVVQ